MAKLTNEDIEEHYYAVGHDGSRERGSGLTAIEASQGAKYQAVLNEYKNACQRKHVTVGEGNKTRLVQIPTGPPRDKVMAALERKYSKQLLRRAANEVFPTQATLTPEKQVLATAEEKQKTPLKRVEPELASSSNSSHIAIGTVESWEDLCQDIYEFDDVAAYLVSHACETLGDYTVHKADETMLVESVNEAKERLQRVAKKLGSVQTGVGVAYSN